MSKVSSMSITDKRGSAILNQSGIFQGDCEASDSQHTDDNAYEYKAQGNFTMWASVFIVMLGAAVYGFDQTNWGVVQTNPYFRQYMCEGKYGNSPDCPKDNAGFESYISGIINQSNVLLNFGTICGMIPIPLFLMNRIGRRMSIIIGACISIFGMLMTTYLCFNNSHVFVAGRFVLGFGIGTMMPVMPTYNGEVATADIRGVCGSLFQFNTAFFGAIAVVICEYGISDHNLWQLSLLLPAIPIAVIFCGMPFIPASPRYIMLRYGYDEGLECLRKIRANDPTEEAQTVWESIEMQRKAGSASVKSFFSNPCLSQRLYVAFMLGICQQISGVDAILGYSATIFGSVFPTDPSMAKLANVVFQFFGVAGIVAGIISIDKDFIWSGRRIQATIAACVMSLGYLLWAIQATALLTPYLAVVGLFVYAFGFQFAWGLVPWLYYGEIFTPSESNVAVPASAVVQKLCGIIIVALGPHLRDDVIPSRPKAFSGFFFSFICAGIAVWSFFQIVETKGITIEHIVQKYSKNYIKGIQWFNVVVGLVLFVGAITIIIGQTIDENFPFGS